MNPSLPSLRPTWFYLPSLPDERFPGFAIKGERRDGHALPLFDHKAASAIADAMGERARYDRENDQFVFSLRAGCTTQRYGGLEHEGGRWLYAIGTYAWPWEEAHAPEQVPALPQLRPTMLRLESLPDEQFPGYVVEGEHWNGFAAPLFPFSVADEIGRALGVGVRYDRENDEFIFESKDDEPERFGGSEYRNGLRLYGIGRYSWIWEDATPLTPLTPIPSDLPLYTLVGATVVFRENCTLRRLFVLPNCPLHRLYTSPLQGAISAIGTLR